jgi:dihydrofolate reductase
MTATIVLVVARANDGTIGHQGKIPWRLSADMRHFKAVTIGKPCIMGRKTWDSLPKKPLPGRTNIVVTRDNAFAAEGAVVVHSFEDAVLRAKSESPEEIAVIGGADMYRAALPHAARIYLTVVQGSFGGDTTLAPLDSTSWEETVREDVVADGAGNPAFSIITLDRRT